MKYLVVALVLALPQFAGATKTFHGFDEFYDSLPGRLFHSTIKRDSSNLYSLKDEEGVYSIDPIEWKGRVLEMILVGSYFGFASPGHFPNRKYNFKSATPFPGEGYSENTSFAMTASVFRRDLPIGNILCIDGGRGSASGEAGSRYQDVYLFVSKGSGDRNQTFLHLPSLLSSCRALRVNALGEIVFPSNEYIRAQGSGIRTGLQIRYFKYKAGKFFRDGRVVNLTFIEPENPFEFVVE